MSTQKVVRIHAYGNRDVLACENAPIPAVGADEVLVKIHATSINPVDWKVREGYLQGFLAHKLPLVLGWDFAGEVAALGTNVSEWKLGDAVYSRPDISRDGAYAEYIAVKASELARKPETVNWQQAAAVPLTALTAWQALYDMVNVQAGERVLIHAGAGGVGSFAIQLAKLRGAYVYTTASTRNVDLVKSLGADEVIDYTKNDFSQLRDLDVVFDTLGGDALAKSWQTLKQGGRLVSIISAPDAATAEQHQVTPFFCFVQPSAAQLTELARLIDAGKIQIIIDSVFALKDIAQAHEKSESGRARGKIVVQVS
ncbi:NADPH:quinone reductase [Cellvibrio zantedeschiae]|uniref:NADPH:quinone reductase n=1 Tax=Cellvibrio zantedeschiae TaxID=1237077 RepID=A0ABQ3ARR4_9GAMM|nr:NADP-dependent oxidoreductase [Cellvibrio zantedeschiae]GGY65189.1 NADPH:quinone reductase [Cellvibrio zantedeschiae]